MHIENLAAVIHEAHWAYCQQTGITVSMVPWEIIPEKEKIVLHEYIKAICVPTQVIRTPSMLQDEWLMRMSSKGWQCADRFDPVLRTSPLMVAYADLSDYDKALVNLSFALAHIFAHEVEWDEEGGDGDPLPEPKHIRASGGVVIDFKAKN